MSAPGAPRRRPRKAWTAAEDATLRQLHATATQQSIAAAIGCTADQVKVRCGQLGLAKKTRAEWKRNEDEILRADYADQPAASIAEQLGRPLSQVYARAHRLGLAKSEQFLASPMSGRVDGHNRATTGRFKKGQPPPNAGIKGWQAGGRAAETQFKAGAKPVNYVPIGTERCTSDGYLRRKTTETGLQRRDWKFVHLLLWEEHNGPVPEGHMVVFRDRDRRNITIENLEIVTRAEHMARHTIQNYPSELKDVMRLKGRLTRIINEASREEQN